jgi:hypothetical protein
LVGDTLPVLLALDPSPPQPMVSHKWTSKLQTRLVSPWQILLIEQWGSTSTCKQPQSARGSSSCCCCITSYITGPNIVT